MIYFSSKPKHKIVFFIVFYRPKFK